MANLHLIKAALGNVQAAGANLFEYIQQAPRGSDETNAMLAELTEKAGELGKLENLLGRIVIAERKRNAAAFSGS